MPDVDILVHNSLSPTPPDSRTIVLLSVYTGRSLPTRMMHLRPLPCSVCNDPWPSNHMYPLFFRRILNTTLTEPPLVVSFSSLVTGTISLGWHTDDRAVPMSSLGSYSKIRLLEGDK